MKNSICRIIPALLTAALLVGLVSCSGGETPQGSSAAKPEQNAAVAQTQPAGQPAEAQQAQPAQQAQQAQPAAEVSKTAESQPAAAQQEAQPAQKAENAPETPQPAASETAEITGTVMVGDAGVVIQTDEGDVGVTGQDLTPMAGKTVNVVGTLQESDGRRMIQVISVVEVK
jgi:hypothetical protein